jgi:Mn2+/Fe2+ NRAMP family transporter
LRPVAGKLAFLLFSLGMLGTGLLAVPSLSGSAAYAIAEAAGWPSGLDHKARRAKRFYAVLVGAMAIGTALNFLGIDPMRALVWSAVANGVAAAPIMAVIIRMARNPDIMGKFSIPPGLARNGWCGTALMGAAALIMLATL